MPRQYRVSHIISDLKFGDNVVSNLCEVNKLE